MEPTAPHPGTAPHPDTTPRPRTRRRGDDLRNAIFAAVMDELAGTGYVKLTMESVATAAGTGKAALYRRWSNKDELITETLRSVLPDPHALPLGGSVRDDVLALLRCLRDAVHLTYGVAFQVVKQEASAGMVQAMVVGRVLDPCRDLIHQALSRGAETGELGPAATGPALAAAGPALLVHYALTESPEVPDDFLASIVDEVVLPAARR